VHWRAVQPIHRSIDFIQRRMHMTNEILTARVAQAFLAVTATVASVLVLQFAMLAG
jgi:hypothetical protein